MTGLRVGAALPRAVAIVLASALAVIIFAPPVFDPACIGGLASWYWPCWPRSTVGSDSSRAAISAEDFPVVLPHRRRERVTGPPLDGYCPGNLSVQVPYPWFCHPTGEQLLLTGPDGQPVPIHPIGRFHSSASEHVYHLKVTLPGVYALRGRSGEVARFRAHPERCRCPENPPDFRRRFGCSEADARSLHRIFARWRLRSVSEAVFSDREQFMRFEPLAHVVIKNNAIFFQRATGEAYGEQLHPDFRIAMQFMQSLLRKVRVPDCEFYHADGLREAATDFRDAVPAVLAYSTRERSADIPGPSVEQMRWIMSGEALQAAGRGLPWEERRRAAVFRGTPEGPALKTVEEMRFNPRIQLAVEVAADDEGGLLNAKLKMLPEGGSRDGAVAAAQGMRASLELRGAVGMEDNSTHLASAHKLVVSLDGSGPDPYLLLDLASGALVLKQQSPFKDWFHDSWLEDGGDVLHFDRSLHDLRPALRWAAAHDAAVRQLAANAFHTWAQRLRAEDAYCWLLGAVEGISRINAFLPEVRENMTRFSDNTSDEHCQCAYGGEEAASG